jgi:hypothetical protein
MQCMHGYTRCFVCHDHKIMAVDEDGDFVFVDVEKFNSLVAEGKAKYVKTEETDG